MDKNRWFRAGVGIVVLFVLGVFLRLARPILVPFAMALLFAFAVSPALDLLARRKVPKALALALILLLAFAGLYLIGTVFYAGGKSLAAELPSYTEVVRSFLGEIDRLVPDPRLKVGLTEWIQGLNFGRAGSVLLAALGPFFGFMSDLLLVFLSLIFILSGRGRLQRKIAVAFPPAQAEKIGRTVARIDREVQRYLAVKTLTNLLIGLLVAAALAAFGVRFAVLFGVLAFLLNYVPALGAAVSVALSVLFATFLEGGPDLKIAVLLAILAAVHAAPRLLVEQRLMGKTIPLAPLLVLFSLFFGAWLWGVPGMILAVPALRAGRIVCENVEGLRPLGRMMDR
ncbi:MAG TPA: AI-2E family transporter [Candidatus Aminicenantes bacterium]|nr:AI-2E family transporter [Candidatus Aminicenantes bacterium]